MSGYSLVVDATPLLNEMLGVVKYQVQSGRGGSGCLDHCAWSIPFAREQVATFNAIDIVSCLTRL